MLSRAQTLSAGAVLAALALSGCNGPEQQTTDERTEAILDFAQQARDAGYQGQYDLLADGDVTQAEYETAVDAGLACNRELGRQTYEPWVNPVDGITIMYDFLPGYGIPADGAGSERDCETENIIFVSSAYQAVNPAVMEEPLRVYVSDCATRAGLDVSGDETNIAEFVRSVGDSNGQALLDCVSEGLNSLYPEQPLYSYGY